MKKQKVRVADSQSIAAQLHLVFALLSRNVENVSGIALAYIARHFQQKAALSNAGFSSDQGKRSRHDSTTEYAIELGATELIPRMRDRVDISQLGGLDHLHRGRAVRFGRSGDGRRAVLLNGIPGVARMALALPLCILLATFGTAVAEGMIRGEEPPAHRPCRQCKKKRREAITACLGLPCAQPPPRGPSNPTLNSLS